MTEMDYRSDMMLPMLCGLKDRPGSGLYSLQNPFRIPTKTEESLKLPAANEGSYRHLQGISILKVRSDIVLKPALRRRSLFTG